VNSFLSQCNTRFPASFPDRNWFSGGFFLPPGAIISGEPFYPFCNSSLIFSIEELIAGQA
jgi:hypothetical protein